MDHKSPIELKRQCLLKEGTEIYSIINPSDSYTLRADNLLVAASGIALVGNGAYGLIQVSNEEIKTPVGFGWDEWLEEQVAPLDYKDWSAYLDDHLLPVAEVLDSVLIGTPEQRQQAEKKLREMDPLEWPQFLAEWHDRRRSSINDIGKHCWEYAHHLRTVHEKRAMHETA